MRIGIQTWGSEGDISPLMALGAGLVAAGHKVSLAATAAERRDYASRANRLGVSMIDAGYIGRDAAAMAALARRVHDEAHPIKQLDLILAEMFEPGVGRMLEVAQDLCRESDVLVGHFIVHPAHAAAEKAGRPYLTVTLNHSAIPNRQVPLMGTPNLGPLLNGLLWKVGEKVLNSHIAPHINRLRSKLGLRPVSSYREVWESRVANLIAVSAALCPPGEDWGPHQHVCGFFRVPEAAEPYELPMSLRAFLEDGPAPVFCTFGSMMAVDDGSGGLNASTRLLVEGARLAECRAIVQSRWDLLQDISDSKDLYKLTAAPHSRILPQCAAVVHHGGAGTTQTVLAHGLPSVVVPHISDQYFWARELARLGAAITVADRRRITAPKLAHGIRQVLGSRDLGAQAKAVGRQMALEDGVASAARIIGGMSPSSGERPSV